MNLCSLVGHVAQAPTVQGAGEGHTCTFTLTLEERRTGPAPKAWTLYVPCTSYGRSAEACRTLQAQDLVAVQGRLSWHKHTHKCGHAHSQLVVRVQEVQVLDAHLCAG